MQRAERLMNLGRLGLRYEGSVPLLVRAITVALLGGGAIGAVTAFALQRGFWPWPMPDLAYRFLAGAAVAYAVGSLITLRRSGWAESEMLLATVIIYGIPLGIAMLIEPDPVDWSKLVAWMFVAIVVPALAISIGALWLNRNVLAEQSPAPLFPPLRALIAVIALLSGAVGLLVFIVPRESGFVWPWAELAPWKALDSRLLASMLLTISGGAALLVWRNRRAMADVFLPMLWAYCIVASIGLIIHAADTPRAAHRGPDLRRRLQPGPDRHAGALSQGAACCRTQMTYYRFLLEVARIGRGVIHHARLPRPRSFAGIDTGRDELRPYEHRVFYRGKQHKVTVTSAVGKQRNGASCG